MMMSFVPISDKMEWAVTIIVLLFNFVTSTNKCILFKHFFILISRQLSRAATRKKNQSSNWRESSQFPCHILPPLPLPTHASNNVFAAALTRTCKFFYFTAGESDLTYFTRATRVSGRIKCVSSVHLLANGIISRLITSHFHSNTNKDTLTCSSRLVKSSRNKSFV